MISISTILSKVEGLKPLTRYTTNHQSSFLTSKRTSGSIKSQIISKTLNVNDQDYLGLDHTSFSSIFLFLCKNKFALRIEATIPTSTNL